MITGEQLKKFLWEQGVMPVDGMLIADSKYSLPDPDWMQSEMCPAFGRLLNGLGLELWREEVNDCDDFARMLAAHSGLVHRLTGRMKTGLAVGEFWYQRSARNGGGGHAINAAVVRGASRTGGGLALRFYEPQTQRPVLLDKAEIESCSGARF